MLSELAAILGLAAGTWLIRAGFIVSPRGRALAVRLDPWLTYARPAVLAGLLASLSMRGTAVDDLGLLAYAVAVVLAVSVGSVTHSLTYALIAGVLGLVVLA